MPVHINLSYFFINRQNFAQMFSYSILWFDSNCQTPCTQQAVFTKHGMCKLGLMDSVANIYNFYSENVTAINKTQNICYLPPTSWRHNEIRGDTVVP